MPEKVYFYVATVFVEEKNRKSYSAVNLWEFLNPNNKTDKDEINAILADGWELVAVTPITIGGNTSEILFTFKRKTPG